MKVVRFNYRNEGWHTGLLIESKTKYGRVVVSTGSHITTRRIPLDVLIEIDTDARKAAKQYLRWAIDRNAPMTLRKALRRAI